MRRRAADRRSHRHRGHRVPDWNQDLIRSAAGVLPQAPDRTLTPTPSRSPPGSPSEVRRVRAGAGQPVPRNQPQRQRDGGPKAGHGEAPWPKDGVESTRRSCKPKDEPIRRRSSDSATRSFQFIIPDNQFKVISLIIVLHWSSLTSIRVLQLRHLIVVNGGSAPDAPTPEHNRLQLLFRDPKMQIAVYRAVVDKQELDDRTLKQLGDHSSVITAGDTAALTVIDEEIVAGRLTPCKPIRRSGFANREGTGTGFGFGPVSFGTLPLLDKTGHPTTRLANWAGPITRSGPMQRIAPGPPPAKQRRSDWRRC